MKQLIWLALAAVMFGTTSCEMTREISIEGDGSGTYVSTIDMSSMMGMAKMMGGDEAKELQGKKIDSSFQLSALTDSIAELSAEQKKVAGKGTFHMLMDAENDLLKTEIKIPFGNTKELQMAHGLSGRGNEAMLKMLGTAKDQTESLQGMEGMDDLGVPKSTIDDYYTVEFAAGRIVKKLNAEKYAKLSEDKDLMQMKDVSAMGMSTPAKTIIHLPKPVKKAEGNQLTVSEDGKTVTIIEGSEDFFEDGKKLEYLIEY